jgi:RNA polymerase sigma-70 factor, ECF subfamily
MNEQERHDLFSQLIARHQSELYAYIFAIVRSWQDADDLFQSVCVILWRKFESFRPATDFFSWARQTAKFEVRKFLARKQAPTYVNDALLDAMAETTLTAQHGPVEVALTALRQCRQKLDAADEELLDLRYVQDLGSREIADRLQRPQTSVCRSLNRIRNWLLDCVEKELNRQEHSGRKLP